VAGGPPASLQWVGAMPPVLGWSAVTGEVSSNALLLLLIIFVWTPPHFWTLALYRKQEYAKAGIPMLPVTMVNTSPARTSCCTRPS